MKHLKKLSLVFLLTTLFSVSFTSCIDDGVSEAVDQVYLAQAGFLQAQSALKNAEAQFQIAKAATEAANAKLVLANAASIEAATAGVIITNTLNAGLNANQLTLAAATLKTNLEIAAGALAAAQSANAVAMVALSDAVKAAKNTLLNTLFSNYATTVAALDAATNARLAKLGAIATQELYLAAGGTESMAFIQAALVADLAALEAGLVSANAEIVRLQGLSASTAQQDVTALKAQKAALNTSRNTLGVTLAARENSVEVARAAWLKASTDNNDVNTKKGEISTLSGLISGLNTQKNNAQGAIDKANNNIAGLPAAQAAVTAVDTTTAYNAIVAQKALIGSSYAAATAGSAPKTGTSLNDVYFNKQIDARKAENKFAAAEALIAASFVQIQNLEAALGVAELALNPVSPAALLILQNAWIAATDAEALAQTKWEGDPSGFTAQDNLPNNLDMSILGNFADGTVGVYAKTWRRVATWKQSAPLSIVYVPETFYPEAYDNAQIVAAQAALVASTALTGVSSTTPTAGIYDIPALTSIFKYNADGTGGVDGTGFGIGNFTPRSVAEVTEAIGFSSANDVDADILTAYFINVESDDTSISNYTALQTARTNAQNTEDAYNVAVASNATNLAAYNLALTAVQNAYVAVGTAWATAGFLNLSDYNAIIDYVGVYGLTAATSSGLGLAKFNALAAETTALGAISTATTKLGTDFRPLGYVQFATTYSQWWTISSTPSVTVITNSGAYTSASDYQQVTGLVSATVTGRIYRLPHSATSSSTTLYQHLRNAYFNRVWAQEAVTALGSVTYASPYSELGSSNAQTITEGTADIAHINTLLPSHIAALAQLNAELAVLVAAAGNLDTLLWDNIAGTFTMSIDGVTTNVLGYIPLLVTYLNAIVARDAVTAQMVANFADQALIQNSIDHIILYITGATPDVAAFNSWRNTAIDAQKDLINGTGVTDGFIKDIEQAKVLISKGLITKADAVLLLAELKRELAVIETQIKFNSDAAVNILARINALLAS